MRIQGRWMVLVFAMALFAGACTGSESEETTTTVAPQTTTTLGTTTTIATTTTAETTTTEPPNNHGMEGLGRTVTAPAASITVDGDPSDWALVPGLATTLEPIAEEAGEGIEKHDVVIRMAHDDEFVYSLFTIADDYNFNADDAHLTASPAWLFPVSGGGPHMGADDDAGEHTTGMVDIWHWELECAGDVASGGAVNPAGDGKDPGNDATCNMDDEWSTDFETREDDNGAGAENSLLGHWSHSNPTDDGPGVWYFEMSRPLQTGDEQDAQFTIGEASLLALAYWDPDIRPEGWDADHHIQSANQGWITVNFK